jgi:tetratricopeptide (TPR) repeat protein
LRLTARERLCLERGRRGVERGDPEAALADLETLLDARPGFADAHYWVGLARERRGDLDEAARSLESALRINPGYAEARLALASVYEQQGQWERARGLAEAARGAAGAGRGARHGHSHLDATTAGKLANLQAALGEAYREAGEWDEAVNAFRKALEYGPGFHDVRLRLAVALREAGLPRQAVAELLRILRADPKQAAARVQLGVTWWSVGRREDALAAWREALVDEEVRAEAQAYLRMAGAD